MSAITREDVIRRLRTVNDPELQKDLVTLNMAKGVAINNGLVTVHIELTTPACPLKDQVKNDVAQAAAAELGVPFLGGIPLNARIREFGDAVTPERTFTSAGELVLEAVEKVASALAGQISIRSLQKAAQPTLSIE
jgi:hypothetical protein